MSSRKPPPQPPVTLRSRPRRWASYVCAPVLLLYGWLLPRKCIGEFGAIPASGVALMNRQHDRSDAHNQVSDRSPDVGCADELHVRTRARALRTAFLVAPGKMIGGSSSMNAMLYARWLSPHGERSISAAE